MNSKMLKALLLSFLLMTVFTVFMPVAEIVTWSSDFRLTDNSTWDVAPSIAQMNDGDIWIVWQTSRNFNNMEIYLKTYNGTWSTPIRLTNNSASDISPAIAQASNGTIWLAWTSDRTGNNDVFYKTSSDDGSSWSSEVQLTTDANNDFAPSIATTKTGEIWVFWYTNRDGNYEIYYKIFNGSSWTNATALTNNPNSDKRPSATQTRDGKIWVTWGRLEADWEIYYNVFDGSSWLGETRLTTHENSDIDPAVVQDRNGSMWIVWVSREPGITTYNELNYVTSDNYGALWSPATLLTNASDIVDEGWPTIAQGSDKKIWLVWTSDRDEDYEVYYRTSGEISPVHNVAIKSVSSPLTEIYQGENVSINVVTENQGDFNETVTVYCYVNSSLIGSQTTTLSSANSVTMVFPWNTPGFFPGIYVLNATVDPVPGEHTINMGDNTFIDGTINLKILGDVNGDGTIDTLDLNRVEAAYGATPGDSSWDEEADLNRDGFVDALDLAIIGKHYGETI